ncbi:hypothetical protein BH20ACI2_BH20ACI2_28360 [soil metagenome]
MNAKNTTKTFVIALAMMITLAIVPTLAFGQTRILNQFQDNQGNDLVGVWQVSASATVDCQTGLPDPEAPQIRVLYSFNQGGTMSEEEAQPFDGPYRASALGIWKRTSGRNYSAVYTNFVFEPDKTFLFTVKQRTNITLTFDGNSFTQRGTFELRDPNDNLVFSGCFAETATRLIF